MTKEILIKFLNNSCSPTELDEVIRWAKTESFNTESKRWGFDNWTNFTVKDDLEDDEKFSLLFDKIQNKINCSIQNSKHKESRAITLSVFNTWLTRVAAILLLPVLAFLFYTISEKKIASNNYANMVIDSIEIIAPIGSRTVVQLSDGSEVHLNFGSKLKYPQAFNGEIREVIFEGEGFFNVAHNPERPFIVQTAKLNIKALGTAFNVLAYPNEDEIETTLVNGEVVLEQIYLNGNVKTIGRMEPGQHVSFNSVNGSIDCTKGCVEKYIAWKEGKLVFEDAYISEVAQRLSRMFNVDIEVADDILDYFYTVTFVDEPLFQILDLITIATPVIYKTLPRKKMPDGTFSKQKIIIEKRK